MRLPVGSVSVMAARTRTLLRRLTRANTRVGSFTVTTTTCPFSALNDLVPTASLFAMPLEPPTLAAVSNRTAPRTSSVGGPILNAKDRDFAAVIVLSEAGRITLGATTSPAVGCLPGAGAAGLDGASA